MTNIIPMPCANSPLGEAYKVQSRTIEKKLNIFDWGIERYRGEAPKQRYLVDGFIPMSAVSLFIAAGGAGKGMKGINLAMDVAGSAGLHSTFGGQVLEKGSVIVFTAEDNEADNHRRLFELDPNNQRNAIDSPSNSNLLNIVPLPNAGGVFSIVEQTREKTFKKTTIFSEIQDQLRQVPNLKLVIIDPLASFVGAVDINSDPSAGTFVMGTLQELATELNIAILAMHHTVKPSRERGKALEPETLEDLYHSLRGTSALGNGARAVYVLGIAPKKIRESVFTKFEMEPKRHAVYIGGIGKANGKANWEQQIFLRNEIGLLENITEKMKSKSKSPINLEKILLQAISEQEDKKPFTKTKKSGLFERKHELPESLQSISRRDFLEIIDRLLAEKKLGLYEKMDSVKKGNQYLGIPGGFLSQQIVYEPYLLPLFVASVKTMEDLGQPFNQTGISAPWKKKHLLHNELQELTSYQLQMMMEDALRDKLIVLTLYGTAKNAQWLSSPEGGLATEPATYVFKDGAV